MKLICVLFIFMPLSFDFVMPVDPQCSYKYDTWDVVGRIYQCKVQNNLNIISSESAVISGATGSHSGGKNNDDVHGFYADNKKIEIFPRSLEKIYANLKLIMIRFGRIKEIHQSDLKPFLQLERLDLYQNDIEVLEEGLFDFNPKLGYILFQSNKISQIHPNIFDHLTKLTYLVLNGNQCIDKYVDDNSAEVKELIKEVKLQCPSPYKVAYKEVQKLELNLNDLNLQFTEKLTNVENTCLNLNPKISSLEATSKDLINVKNTVASLSTSNLLNKNKLITLQSQISKLKGDSNKIEEVTSKQSRDALKMNSTIEETKRFITLLQIHQNQNIDKLHNLEASLNMFNVSASDVLSKINQIKASVSQQSKDIQAVSKKVQENLQKIHQNMEKVTGEINYLTMESKNNSDKFDKLEEESKANDMKVKSQIDEMEDRLVQKQTNDTQDIKSKIEANINFIAESYMFYFEKIENLSTSVIEVQKKVKASEVKTLKIMEQKMQTLSQEMKAELEASTDKILRKIEQMESRLNSKQPNNVEVINSKIQVIKPSDSNSLKSLEADNKNLKILGDSAHKRITILNGYLTSTNNKVNSTDASLQTLKTEMMTTFGKIVEKLVENAAKIEQNITTKIKVMSTNIQDTYNHAFFHLHKNMKDIESGLAILNSKLILNGIIQVSNDSKLNND